MASLKAYIARRKKIKRWVNLTGKLDRILHYGPADVVDRDIEPGQIQAGDFVYHDKRWAKVRRVNERELITADGRAIGFKDPGDDFLFKKPSQVGLVLFTVFGSIMVSGTLGAISIAVAIYFGLHPHP